MRKFVRSHLLPLQGMRVHPIRAVRFGFWGIMLCWSMIAVVVLVALAACGGGGGGGETIPPATPSPVFTTVGVKPTPLTIDSRRVLAPEALAGLPTVDEEGVFTWAQKWDKDTYKTFFPAGPTTQTGIFDGAEFKFRLYPNGASIRVRTSDKAVFVQWPDTTIRQHGFLADYACVVNDCAAPVDAGALKFVKDASGTSLIFDPKYKGNLITALGAKVDGVDKGFEIPANEVEEVCWYSNRLNNWGTRGGIGCNTRSDDGVWRVTRLANNDCGQATLWTKSGQLLWLGYKDVRGWKVEGLKADISQTCGITYGDNGFTPAVTYAVMEADKTATLIWDLGYHANFAAGVGSKPIDLSDKSVTHVFALNGDRQGKNYGSGWGLGEGRKTPEGFLIEPSIRKAWLEPDPLTGNLILKFKGLACTDKVNITAYRGTGPAANVTYDFGTDGFGLAWGNVGGDNPYWSAGVGTFLISATSQVEYGVPFCTLPAAKAQAKPKVLLGSGQRFGKVDQ